MDCAKIHISERKKKQFELVFTPTRLGEKTKMTHLGFLLQRKKEAENEHI